MGRIDYARNWQREKERYATDQEAYERYLARRRRERKARQERDPAYQAREKARSEKKAKKEADEKAKAEAREKREEAKAKKAEREAQFKANHEAIDIHTALKRNRKWVDDMLAARGV